MLAEAFGFHSGQVIENFDGDKFELVRCIGKDWTGQEEWEVIELGKTRVGNTRVLWFEQTESKPIWMPF